MKTNLRVVVTAVGVAVLMQLGYAVVHAQSSSDRSYSAVATDGARGDSGRGGRVAGYAVGWSSMDEAEDLALKECGMRTSSPCDIVLRFDGSVWFGGPECVPMVGGYNGKDGWKASCSD